MWEAWQMDNLERAAELVSAARAEVIERLDSASSAAADRHERTLVGSLDRLEAAIGAHEPSGMLPGDETPEQRALRVAFHDHERICHELIAALRAGSSSITFDPLRALEVDLRHADLFQLR
jgi:hypothetical protein